MVDGNGAAGFGKGVEAAGVLAFFEGGPVGQGDGEEGSAFVFNGARGIHLFGAGMVPGAGPFEPLDFAVGPGGGGLGALGGFGHAEFGDGIVKAGSGFGLVAFHPGFDELGIVVGDGVEHFGGVMPLAASGPSAVGLDEFDGEAADFGGFGGGVAAIGFGGDGVIGLGVFEVA